MTAAGFWRHCAVRSPQPQRRPTLASGDDDLLAEAGSLLPRHQTLPRRTTPQLPCDVGSAATTLKGETVRVRGFGELEAVVMDRIWNRDPETVTVREIFEGLSAERRIAYTTVMSTMDNLHTKGWLERERDGRAYRYWAIMTREEHTAQLMREALDGGGRSELVLSYFIEQIGPTESERLREALRRLARRSSRAKKR